MSIVYAMHVQKVVVIHGIHDERNFRGCCDDLTLAYILTSFHEFTFVSSTVVLAVELE
jgi:hypothetical protein